MTFDATTSHSIVVPITDEEQLSTAFDTITYDKGASGQWLVKIEWGALTSYRYSPPNDSSRRGRKCVLERGIKLPQKVRVRQCCRTES